MVPTSAVCIDLVPVVQRAGNSIRGINHHPVDSVPLCLVVFFRKIAIYPVDRVIHPLNNPALELKVKKNIFRRPSHVADS